jgi:hypothetical protein
MPRVRMLETVDSPTHRYAEGDEIELSDEAAAVLLNAGQAEAVKGHAEPVKAEQRETATDPGASKRERATR